jgi:hypothetical protein
MHLTGRQCDDCAVLLAVVHLLPCLQCGCAAPPVARCPTHLHARLNTASQAKPSTTTSRTVEHQLDTSGGGTENEVVATTAWWALPGAGACGAALTAAHVAPRTLLLDTPTSAGLDLWERHQDDWCVGTRCFTRKRASERAHTLYRHSLHYCVLIACHRSFSAPQWGLIKPIPPCTASPAAAADCCCWMRIPICSSPPRSCCVVSPTDLLCYIYIYNPAVCCSMSG